MRDTFTVRRLAAAVAFTLPHLAGAADLGSSGSGTRDTARGATAFEAPVSETRRATQYGPVKRGETLTKIARIVKYDEATLEQTMVGLHRHNPHAFLRSNMNLLRTGEILQVPEPLIMSSIPQRLAVREIRLQTADWESFQARLAQREAPARRDEARAGEPMNAMTAGIPVVAGAAGASRGTVAPEAAEAQSRSDHPQPLGDAPASAEGPVQERDLTVAPDAMPQTASAAAQTASAVWLGRPEYLAAAGGVLVLGCVALWARRRRTISRDASVAIEPVSSASAVTLAGAADASFASSAGEESKTDAAAEDAPIIRAELIDAPGDAPEAADAILVSVEGEAPSAAGASPIYNTLDGDALDDRASVACASATAASAPATAAFIKAGAALDPLVPSIQKSAPLDTYARLAA